MVVTRQPKVRIGHFYVFDSGNGTVARFQLTYLHYLAGTGSLLSAYTLPAYASK